MAKFQIELRGEHQTVEVDGDYFEALGTWVRVYKSKDEVAAFPSEVVLGVVRQGEAA